MGRVILFTNTNAWYQSENPSTYNRFQKKNPPKNNRSSFLVKFAVTIPLP